MNIIRAKIRVTMTNDFPVDDATVEEWKASFMASTPSNMEVEIMDAQLVQQEFILDGAGAIDAEPNQPPAISPDQSN